MMLYITWTIDPICFNLFGLEIRWYGVLFAVGYLISYEIVKRIFKRDGAPGYWLDKLVIYTLTATLIGARLGHCFFYDPVYYISHPIEILYVWNGGLSSHGGLVGAVLGIMLFARKYTKISPLWSFDRFIVSVALIGAFLRIGNLMNHEIYGLPTALPFAFKFITNLDSWHAGEAPIFTLPCHPTAIYEAVSYFFIAFLLLIIYYKTNASNRPGMIMGVFLIAVFSIRFLIEFIKVNQVPFEDQMILNMGQILSIPCIVIGLYLFIRSCVKPPVVWTFPK